MSRATSFNKNNVANFYNNLSKVLNRYNFTASRIWNTDETGVSTVMRPSKIVAEKGKRIVGALTSAERGTNVTIIVAVSAAGNSIPPMFLFPRKKYHDHFLRDGPPDSIGLGNGSGWMTDIEFYTFMEHFIKYTKPTKEDPVLLLIDNHSSHLGIKTLDLAKESEVIMLSFPPHCSHKLQPLDVSVYGPFKTYLSSAQDAWMKNNPGSTMTIYNIPAIVRTALPLALTPNNICKGFEKTGIFPYNENIFSECDFAPSYVTDRPNPQEFEHDESHNALNISNNSTIVASNTADEALPSTSSANAEKVVFSPETVKPLPKAGPRKTSARGRKRRQTAILTDTPEKNKLQLEQEQTKAKANKIKQKKNSVDFKSKEENSSVI